MYSYRKLQKEKIEFDEEHKAKNEKLKKENDENIGVIIEEITDDGMLNDVITETNKTLALDYVEPSPRKLSTAEMMPEVISCCSRKRRTSSANSTCENEVISCCSRKQGADSSSGVCEITPSEAIDLSNMVFMRPGT